MTAYELYWHDEWSCMHSAAVTDGYIAFDGTVYVRMSAITCVLVHETSDESLSTVSVMCGANAAFTTTIKDAGSCEPQQFANDVMNACVDWERPIKEDEEDEEDEVS